MYNNEAEVPLTFLIILLSIPTEIYAHYNFNQPYEYQKPLNYSSLTYTVSDSCFHPSPPLAIRTKRFSVTTGLMIPLAVAFGYRMKFALLGDCFEDPGYTFVVIAFAILPFVIGVCACLRTIVDCALVRKGGGVALGYPWAKGDRRATGGIWWPVCGPVGLVFVVAGGTTELIARVVMGKVAVFSRGEVVVDEEIGRVGGRDDGARNDPVSGGGQAVVNEGIGRVGGDVNRIEEDDWPLRTRRIGDSTVETEQGHLDNNPQHIDHAFEEEGEAPPPYEA